MSPRLPFGRAGGTKNASRTRNEEQDAPRDTRGGADEGFPDWSRRGEGLAIILLLATAALFVACGDGYGNGATSDASPATGAASPADADSEELVELQLTAENTQFDKDRLQAPAGSEVSLTLDNRDSLEHTFSLYETVDSNEPLFKGSLFSGPSFLIYQFTAPENPGTYRFQCDVHPDAMFGEFIAE